MNYYKEQLAIKAMALGLAMERAIQLSHSVEVDQFILIGKAIESLKAEVDYAQKRYDEEEAKKAEANAEENPFDCEGL